MLSGGVPLSRVLSSPVVGMASLLRKASRMNTVAMDFVLQVTVVELKVGTLESGRTLSFELSRGTKVRKLISTRSRGSLILSISSSKDIHSTDTIRVLPHVTTTRIHVTQTQSTRSFIQIESFSFVG